MFLGLSSRSVSVKRGASSARMDSCSTLKTQVTRLTTLRVRQTKEISHRTKTSEYLKSAYKRRIR